MTSNIRPSTGFISQVIHPSMGFVPQIFIRLWASFPRFLSVHGLDFPNNSPVYGLYPSSIHPIMGFIFRIIYQSTFACPLSCQQVCGTTYIYASKQEACSKPQRLAIEPANLGGDPRREQGEYEVLAGLASKLSGDPRREQGEYEVLAGLAPELSEDPRREQGEYEALHQRRQVRFDLRLRTRTAPHTARDVQGSTNPPEALRVCREFEASRLSRSISRGSKMLPHRGLTLLGKERSRLYGCSSQSRRKAILHPPEWICAVNLTAPSSSIQNCDIVAC